MIVSIIIVSTLFSIFATAVMSYISMATPIGPWIELIIVLLSTMLFRVFLRCHSSVRLKQAVGLTTVAGGVSGIVATVCGFTFPTLYFLDPELFNSWLASPVYFVSVLSGLIMVSGGFAFCLVHFFQDKMLADENMPFPIGQMVRKMIAAQNQLRKSIELFTGVVLTFVFGVIQRCSGLIPQSLTLVPRMAWGVLQIPHIGLRFDLLPIFIAIGYVAGHVLTVPLTVGVFSKIFILGPVRNIWFADLSLSNFILAFGSGMILQGAFMSFLKLPHVIITAIKKIKQSSIGESWSLKKIGGLQTVVVMGLFFVGAVAFLLHFNFSLLSQLYLFIFAAVCVYQLLIIGGKIGLAPMNRFATFVLLPGLIMFGFDAVQITFVSLFVGLAGGVAVDLMFGRKMGQLADIDQRQIFWFQILGLVVSAVTVGIVFWALINHFGLGSDELVAQRSQARALLVNAFSFNYIVLIVGALFGITLKKLRVNAILVFTGLLFPVHFSLMLIGGGLLTYVPQDKEEWDPFWSGVFAAGSLWMLLKVVI